MSLKPLHLLPPKPGTCQECAVDHTPDFPHNLDSLYYQYFFYDKHGRWPTWMDALEHCDKKIKARWIEELTKRGVDLEN